MHCRVKDIFGEQWDDYQLRCVNSAPEIGGGNKSFFEFMREYKLVDESGWVEPEKRYKHEAIKYYARRLWFRVDESPFNDLPPAKSYAEKYHIGWVIKWGFYRFYRLYELNLYV
jgi:hypothetical protein